MDFKVSELIKELYEYPSDHKVFISTRHDTRYLRKIKILDEYSIALVSAAVVGASNAELKKTLRRVTVILWDIRQHNLPWHKDYNEYLDNAVKLLQAEDALRESNKSTATERE